MSVPWPLIMPRWKKRKPASASGMAPPPGSSRTISASPSQTTNASVAGGPWQDVVAAGASFVSGGYNLTIDPGTDTFTGAFEINIVQSCSGLALDCDLNYNLSGTYSP